ncbi:MAG: hypothetical protein JWO41_824 [Candidatus Saccharibacteria bacterium]|nr:hypothetical protein [Candidatus Saccharibacteria bacterium]
MNGRVKAGCESCSVPCKTFEVDPITIAGFDLVSGTEAIPMTIEAPDISSLGLIARVKERRELKQHRKRVAEFMVGIPTCGGPIADECRFKSGVEELDAGLILFAENMAPILPHLIKH